MPCHGCAGASYWWSQTASIARAARAASPGCPRRSSPSAYQAVSRTRCTVRGASVTSSKAPGPFHSSPTSSSHARSIQAVATVVGSFILARAGGVCGRVAPRTGGSPSRHPGPRTRTRRTRHRGSGGRTPRRARGSGPAGGRGRRTRSGRGSPAPPAAAGRLRGCPGSGTSVPSRSSSTLGSSSKRTTPSGADTWASQVGVSSPRQLVVNSSQETRVEVQLHLCVLVHRVVRRLPRAWRTPPRARPARRAAARRRAGARRGRTARRRPSRR